ncbi:hypothetical protein DL98DRAFT_634269 [Cadophora sp. DSE1049]|nr:hypothetical protein DL98DRAFT_634269 [Cadophora sp. DSE1049]
MADPFSVLAGSAGLLDVLFRVFNYIRATVDSAGRIEEELEGLSHDIQALTSINEAIRETYQQEGTRLPGTSLADAGRVDNLWKNVGTLLKDCQAVVEKLDGLMSEVIGKGVSSKVTGKIDGLRKTLRRDKKDHEIKDTRIKLVSYQNSLQILLTALNLAYTRSSQDSTDLSLGHLSDSVQLIGFKLQAQIASLRPKLQSAAGSPFLDAISPAVDVASLVSINRHFRIPQTVSSIFTGRESLLSDLQGYFDVFAASTQPMNVQKRFIVYGLGGSGKTQFCCKFAQDNRQRFWGIFCIDATSPETAEHSFSKIAKIGNVEPSEGSNLRAAKDWLSSLERPWLLLVDNADDTSHPLEEYFPEGERGCVLVTTRDPTKRVHGTVGPYYYHFEKLAIYEANDLLLKAACHPRPWDTSAIKSTDLIADALGFLPLALVQAGKAIMNGLCSLANYIEHYQRSWQRIRHARMQSGTEYDQNENMNVYSSYEINLKSLEQSQNEEAVDAVQLLKMFSCFYCENICVDVLKIAATNPRGERKQADKDELENAQMRKLSRPKTWTEYIRERFFLIMESACRDRSPPVLPSVLREVQPLSDYDDLLDLQLRHALNVLSRMSLITHDEASDSYSMHPLVHEWARERPEMNIGEQALWCQAATTTLAQCILLPPHGSSETEENMRRNLLPHIDHVRKCQARISARISQNQRERKLSWIPVLKAKFGRRQALEFAKFSRVYSECGLWKEAEQLQLAVKDFVCGMLGTEHPVVMGIMLFLSGTYWNQARTNEAAELQSEVYRACLNSLGPDHPKTLKVMDTLGSSRCFQGRFKEALELHQTAIDGMK